MMMRGVVVGGRGCVGGMFTKPVKVPMREQ